MRHAFKGRRGYAVVLLLGVLGVAACGEQDSSGVAQEPTPTETPTPPYEPSELDRTELDANLASLSPEDRALVDHYLHAKGEEVRDLARLAWSDPESPMAELASWSAVAQAMNEKVTGVRATPAVQDVDEWYAVPVPWGGVEDY